MAYMRGDHYVYTDGLYLHIYTPEGGVELPLPVMEELCAMFWARLTPDQRENAEQRAAHEHSGNIGADALRAKLGLETSTDWLNEAITRRLEERGRETAGETQDR